MKCVDCKYWKGFREYVGDCSKMKEKVQVDLTTGWEGATVNHFETEADFGCVLFEEKESDG